jgi:hydrogenase maturation protein HypF
VPQAIDLGMELEQVLAVGAELKNTFCLTRGRHAILSQHIGDMENYETMRFFEETLSTMKHLFRVSPKAIAPPSRSHNLLRDTPRVSNVKQVAD